MRRRDFLIRSGLGAAALALPLPGCAHRYGIRTGIIGVGNFGASDYHLGRWVDITQVIAVADVDTAKLDAATARSSRRSIAKYQDYRELIARDDIDAVVVVTPDHWHVRPAIEAAESGKHVYCEKPLTLTIAEGKELREAVNRTGIVFQTGSEQRSYEEFHLACECVRNGRIGQLQRIEASIYGSPATPFVPADPQPATLDWDMWLGQAPDVPYHQLRASPNFRHFRDYSGGTITDLGAHELDIAQWGGGYDGTGPVSVSGTGTVPADDFFDTPTTFEVNYTYADGVTLRFYSSDEEWHVQFFGSDGDIYVHRDLIRASRPEILDYKLGSGEVPLHYSRDHFTDWLDAIQNGIQPGCPVEVGHRSATLCHMASIAIQTGRTLTWDPVTEEFVGDAAANALMTRPKRPPWG